MCPLSTSVTPKNPDFSISCPDFDLQDVLLAPQSESTWKWSCYLASLLTILCFFLKGVTFPSSKCCSLTVIGIDPFPSNLYCLSFIILRLRPWLSDSSGCSWLITSLPDSFHLLLWFFSILLKYRFAAINNPYPKTHSAILAFNALHLPFQFAFYS